MNPNKAFLKLKESLTGNKKVIRYVMANLPQYRIEVIRNLNESIHAIESGQSALTIGELNRQFYNATHHQIEDQIIELPGSDFCREIGEISYRILTEQKANDDMIEEMIISSNDCNETVDSSYI